MSIRLLAVARWPLGGIRTYMRYVYGGLPSSCRVTIVSPSTHEDEALKQDAEAIGAALVFHPGKEFGGLARSVRRELAKGKHDILQSHGFISGGHAYLANIPHRVPHVLTVHGILEEKYVRDFRGRIRLALLSHVLRNVDFLYTVSRDMLDHLHESVPELTTSKSKKVVIPNGIDLDLLGEESEDLRKEAGLDKDMAVIGFVGRFMQQKGFEYLVEASEILMRRGGLNREFRIVAIGSGDYLREYRESIRQKNLDDRFVFLPFRPGVHRVYRSMDAIAMPSIWEASGLVAMEALCMGVPLVASDCIGLRETVAGTPAMVFESRNSIQLADALRKVINDPPRKVFENFAPIARKRYDVRETANALDTLFQEILS